MRSMSIAAMVWLGVLALLEGDGSGAPHAAREESGGNDPAVVADDEILPAVTFERPHAAVATDGVTNALPGGLVEEDDVRAAGTNVRSVVEDQGLKERKSSSGLVPRRRVSRSIEMHNRLQMLYSTVIDATGYLPGRREAVKRIHGSNEQYLSYLKVTPDKGRYKG